MTRQGSGFIYEWAPQNETEKKSWWTRTRLEKNYRDELEAFDSKLEEEAKQRGAQRTAVVSATGTTLRLNLVNKN